MRKLATVQIIEAIRNIQGADAIEVARVLGWDVVVKKGEFQPGDKVLYLEIDSLIPQWPEVEFLAKQGTKTCLTEDGKQVTGYRLKTAKLRGQISQGLVLSLNVAKTHVFTPPETPLQFNVGDDLSEVLGVYKYEAPISASLSGVAKGYFPSFIPKTDEPRIQTAPDVLARHRDAKFYVTEKIDGTSMTVFYKDGELNVCGRNINLKETPESTYWKVARALDLENKLQGMTIALQGELYGESIQKNKLQVKGQKYAIFSMYDFDAGRYLSYDEMLKVAKSLGLELVPILDDNYSIPVIIEPLVQYATRKSVINSNTWVEGVVIRPLVETYDEKLGRLSFKVINPEFLLEYNE